MSFVQNINEAIIKREMLVAIMCVVFVLFQPPEEADASQKPPEPVPVEETPPEPEKAE